MNFMPTGTAVCLIGAGFIAELSRVFKNSV